MKIKTKIIVTGGLGFIGSNLIELLIKKNFYVINIDKVSYSSNFYNVRDFRPGDPMTPKSERPGRMFVKNLRSVFTPAPGRDVVPWYKKRKLRSNPYNSNGVLCSKEDSDE